MTSESDVYRRLQKHIDNMPVAFPATRSGVELRILRRLFTPEEAEVGLLLSAVPENLDRIHRRAGKAGLAREELERILDRLVEKGAILGGGSGDRKRYSKAQLAVGMYELQVDKLTKEFQQDVAQYFQEGFGEAFHGPRTGQMRTIPVNARFVPERRVGRYDDARQLIEGTAGPIAVMNCVCRQGKDLLDEPCQQTEARRVCMTFKGAARKLIAQGTAQAVSHEEALACAQRAEEDGMVLQPENTQDPSFICFCCGCCCGVLSTAKQLPRPAEYLQSNYCAVVDPELCTECETCHSRCPMDALDSSNGATRVEPHRCIGCGLCVTTCPSEALSLVAKKQRTVPPRDQRALYRKIMRERFGVLRTARMVGNALLGRRV
ncbi:MAG: 4Fe-4S binding protein [Acidobacteria bacterium]|nr:4Fe-4S binding protein [Acidobacteriota bacterium]